MIDTTFDFMTDAAGKDPDKWSPTLRRYHQTLWSRPLPCGTTFDLDVSTPGVYLHHRSALGDFELASDSVIATFAGWVSTEGILRQIPDDAREAFESIGYTIGGMMVFPGNRVDGKMTINGARGFTRKIADRFDLTLECIRRHYRSEDSPLGETLRRYGPFFSLFEDFRGYVEFFLLQDLVTEAGDQVRFFTPFNDFRTPAVPRDLHAYEEFRHNSIAFVKSRNARIDLLGLCLT